MSQFQHAPPLAALAALVKPGQRVTAQALARAGILPARRPLDEVRRTLTHLAVELVNLPTPPPFIVDEDGELWRRRLSAEECRRAVVDVNNILWTLHRDPGRVADLLRWCRGAGIHEVVAVADANITEICGDGGVEAIQAEATTFIVVPRGTRADEQICAEARGGPCFVLSNDHYRGYAARPAWRVRVGVVAAEDTGWRLSPHYMAAELSTANRGTMARERLDFDHGGDGDSPGSGR